MSDTGATIESTMEEAQTRRSPENRRRRTRTLSEVFATASGIEAVLRAHCWRRIAVFVLYVLVMTWVFLLVAPGGLERGLGIIVALLIVSFVVARILQNYSLRSAGTARRRRQRIPRAVEARLQLRHPGIELGRLQLLLVDRDFTGDDYQVLLDLDDANEVPSTVGASESEIRRNPSFLFTEPDPESVSKPKSCTICLYQFKPRERVRLIPCMHQFHTECIDPWLRRNAICPVCKFPVVG